MCFMGSLRKLKKYHQLARPSSTFNAMLVRSVRGERGLAVCQRPPPRPPPSLDSDIHRLAEVWRRPHYIRSDIEGLICPLRHRRYIPDVEPTAYLQGEWTVPINIHPVGHQRIVRLERPKIPVLNCDGVDFVAERHPFDLGPRNRNRFSTQRAETVLTVLLLMEGLHSDPWPIVHLNLHQQWDATLLAHAFTMSG